MSRLTQCARGLLLFAAALMALSVHATPPNREALTNQSIVTLAGAGFDEDFISETIAASRTHFDLSVDGLAALAKQGINEHVIRMMMHAPATPQQSAARPAPAPNNAPDLRVLFKARAAPLAIVSGTPYFEMHSYLWGLLRTHVSVGGAARSDHSLAPYLGAVYQRMSVR